VYKKRTINAKYEDILIYPMLKTYWYYIDQDFKIMRIWPRGLITEGQIGKKNSKILNKKINELSKKKVEKQKESREKNKFYILRSKRMKILFSMLVVVLILGGGLLGGISIYKHDFKGMITGVPLIIMGIIWIGIMIKWTRDNYKELKKKNNQRNT